MAPTPLTWNGTDSQGQPLRWNTPGLVWGGTVPQPNKKMPKLRVSLAFAGASEHELEERAQAVSEGLYGVAAFADPPVTKAALDAALAAFSASIAAAQQGGPADTADKNNKQVALIDLLYLLADHVDDHHGNDLALLLSSGFEAVSTNRAQSPLPQATIKDVLPGNSTEMILRVERINNAVIYEAQYALLNAEGTPGPWQDADPSTKSQRILVTGLVPGQRYQFRVRAVGGSTGYGDWSDVVIKMAV